MKELIDILEQRYEKTLHDAKNHSKSAALFAEEMLQAKSPDSALAAARECQRLIGFYIGELSAAAGIRLVINDLTHLGGG